jgi:hypothetical protein
MWSGVGLCFRPHVRLVVQHLTFEAKSCLNALVLNESEDASPARLCCIRGRTRGHTCTRMIADNQSLGPGKTIHA